MSPVSAVEGSSQSAVAATLSRLTRAQDDQTVGAKPPTRDGSVKKSKRPQSWWYGKATTIEEPRAQVPELETPKALATTQSLRRGTKSAQKVRHKQSSQLTDLVEASRPKEYNFLGKEKITPALKAYTEEQSTVIVNQRKKNEELAEENNKYIEDNELLKARLHRAIRLLEENDSKMDGLRKFYDNHTATYFRLSNILRAAQQSQNLLEGQLQEGFGLLNQLLQPVGVSVASSIHDENDETVSDHGTLGPMRIS